MLCALASSPLSWTGAGRLSVVGYSLGGGIAIHFANAFPDLVGRLVLLAPAGLIRAKNFGVASRLLFQSGVVPERLLAKLTARRLQQPIAQSRVKLAAAAAATAAKQSQKKTKTEPQSNGLHQQATNTQKQQQLDSEKNRYHHSHADGRFVDAALAEVADPSPADEDQGLEPPPVENRILEYVRWMVVHHAGFIPAFMSCIRHAPLTEQHDSWRGLASRKPGSTIILLARADEIIDVDDYRSDALPLVGGEANVVWKVLPGGHDFVMTHSDEILGVLETTMLSGL
jgi:pimeloyl-ACP methyl ester carboxylesterase